MFRNVKVNKFIDREQGAAKASTEKHRSAHSGPREAEAGDAEGRLQSPAWVAQQHRQEGRGQDQQRSPELEEKKTAVEVYTTDFRLQEEQRDPEVGVVMTT